MSYIKFTDQRLLERLVQAADKAAFTEIYERYWSVMYMHALKMLQEEEDARDAVQDLFVTLWSKAATMPSHTNLAGYLFVSLRNKVLDRLKHSRIRTDYFRSLATYIDQPRDTILEAISERELNRAFEQEIAQLPPKMKAIFELRVKEYKTYQEIAAQLRISDKTVKKQISNAIRIIRPRFQKGKK